MDVFILLVEEDGVRCCEGVDGFQDGVQWCWAFRAVEEKGALGAFDELGLFGFEDARCARVLGFSGRVFVSIW